MGMMPGDMTSMLSSGDQANALMDTYMECEDGGSSSPDSDNDNKKDNSSSMNMDMSGDGGGMDISSLIGGGGGEGGGIIEAVASNPEMLAVLL